MVALFTRHFFSDDPTVRKFWNPARKSSQALTPPLLHSGAGPQDKAAFCDKEGYLLVCVMQEKRHVFNGIPNLCWKCVGQIKIMQRLQVRWRYFETVAIWQLNKTD